MTLGLANTWEVLSGEQMWKKNLDVTYLVCEAVKGTC